MRYKKRDVSEPEASQFLAAVAAVLVGVLIAVLVVILIGILIVVLGSVLIAVLVLVIHDASSIIFPAVRPLSQYARNIRIYPLF